MEEEKANAIFGYDVEECPKCGLPHHFELKVRVSTKGEEKVVLFGGAAGGSEFLFACPETNQKFTQIVPNPPHGEIVGLATKADVIQTATKSSNLLPVDNAFSEWVKNSRKVALEFCKTMLGTSTGAIPIYFAVLKYIGFEKIGQTALGKFTVVPPALFLLAAILYVLALRPRYDAIAPDEFNTFRARRLEKLNKYIIWGTTTFVGATGLAITVFFYALSR